MHDHPSIVFVTYEVDLASYRYRVRPLVDELAAGGWHVREHELARGRYLLQTWRLRRELRAADVVLLQYMAASLPAVGSPVGANLTAVVDGDTGYLPADTAAWESCLVRLLGSPELRRRMGGSGRARVVEHYSMAAFRTSYVQRLSDLVGSSGAASRR